MHRYDPVTLKSVWKYETNDNASSADPVLVDIDGDGEIEVIKSVDNYAGDDAHDAVYAFETDGTLIWKTPGLAGEDSPNVADLDGDGEVEIVGMTFGGEVYCLDSKGRIKWRKDLRPKLSDSDAHAYLTPILCDVDGDKTLEILALTNGGYFDASGKAGTNRKPAPAIIFALSADGKVLDRFNVGGTRYWGSAFVCNVDDDPLMELVVAGSGGVDVIETKGLGPNTEHFQRRRSYQRLNVVPWAYEDSFFIYRGQKDGVTNRTDNLVLTKDSGGYSSSGTFTTELLTLPPNCAFDRIRHEFHTPDGTALDPSGTWVETPWGQPVIDRGAVGQWDHYAVDNPYVHAEDGILYCFFEAQDKPLSQGGHEAFGLAVSSDSNRWEKGPSVNFRASVEPETLSNPFLSNGLWTVLYEQKDRIYRAILQPAVANPLIP